MSDLAAALRSVRERTRAGDFATARGELTLALARHGPALGPADTDRIGRALAKLLAPAADPGPVRRIRLCGQVTTARLATALRVAAFADGVGLVVEEADYDNVVQDLAGGSAADRDAVVLLPSGRELLAPDDRDTATRIDDELATWRAAWSAIRAAGAARIVQVGLDWRVRGPTRVAAAADRSDEPRERVAAANAALRAALPPSEIFVDVAALADEIGRRQLYDARRDLWTRQPWSETGVLEVARAIWAAVRAALLGPKKVLVLDCDDTLWGGVVGETGALGVTLGGGPEGEAYVAFQRHVRGLQARGVLLAVVTKNEPDDARGPFVRHESMVLRLPDLAAFEAGWGPKSEGLRRIAAQLGLSLDAFVFFDDSAFERGEVRQALPEVAVVEVPPDPADYVAALEAGRWFDALQLTSDDRARTGQYAAEAQRATTRAQYGDLGAYLDSLQLVGRVGPIGADDLDRVVQLVGKTNQFNATTRRHSAAAIAGMLATEGAIGLALRLSDRFGDYGLVGVVLAVPEGAAVGTLRVDTLLMSCRAIGRTAEWYLLGELCERATAAGHHTLVGEWIATPKNAQLRELWPTLGLVPDGEPGPDGAQRYRAALADVEVPETFVARFGA